MSRRARLEEERAKEFEEEILAEENRIKARNERIFAPIIWKRLGSGVRIQDLKPQYHDAVLSIIKEHYMPDEVLCRNTHMVEDEESVQSFLKMTLMYMNDRTSILALDEMKEDAVCGFVILKAMHKKEFDDVFCRVVPVHGEAHKKCMEFINHLARKQDLYAMFGCEIYLRYYMVCVLPEYRKKGVGLHMMMSALDVARSLNIPVVMGIFSSWSLQKKGSRIGMKTIYEVNYIGWKDKRGQMIFEDPGAGNYTLSLMAGVVPPPPPPPPPQKVEEDVVKLTRAEKRAAKEKATKKKPKLEH